MKLYFHRGKNFGDQLNILIFDYFMPNAFDDDEENIFVGIGSLIGLVSRFPGRKIVFSSGLADGDESTYGKVPKDLSSYEFLCVRGPLTAKKLGIKPELAITDGAILLAAMNLPLVRSHEVISFMPHAGSEQFYDHQKMAMELGWQFISPSEEPLEVLKKMMRSKYIVTEAMHGAIVADTLRIPWIPYVGFSTVNHFKWKDWCASMNLNYSPIVLKAYFSDEKIWQLTNKRLALFWKGGLQFLAPLTVVLLKIVMKFRWVSNRSILRNEAKQVAVNLSAEDVFNDRLKRMLEKVEEIKMNRELWDK